MVAGILEITSPWGVSPPISLRRRKHLTVTRRHADDSSRPGAPRSAKQDVHGERARLEEVELLCQAGEGEDEADVAAKH